MPIPVSATPVISYLNIETKYVLLPLTAEAGDRVLLTSENRSFIGDYFPCNCGRCCWLRVKGKYLEFAEYEIVGVLSFTDAAPDQEKEESIR